MRFFKILFSPITAPIHFVQRNFKATLLIILVVIFYQNTDPQVIEKPNLQTINLQGAISDPTDILEQINKAKDDKKIKGVLLIINSPGGAVAPSVEIAYAIKELNSVKPVIAYASGTMASGSYYSAIWAKKILANPGSMIGSIGVIMQSVDTSDLMNKIGIKTQTVKMGEYKEVGTPTRQWSKKERAELNKVIKSTYDMFVSDVAKARKLDIKDQDEFANAHIFTATQAKDVGLIDQVTTINNAKLIVQKEANITKAVWNKQDKFDKLIDKFLQNKLWNISAKLNGLMAY